MSMFNLVCAAIANSVSGGGGGGSNGSATAAWNNITGSGDTLIAETNAASVTFTGGGAKQIYPTYSSAYGTMSYRKNGGSRTELVSGQIISVNSGDTITFRYANIEATSESFTVEVRDYDLGNELIDSFEVQFTYTGGGGGGLPP